MSKTTRRELIAGVALSAIGATAQEQPAGQPLTLWYRKPAEKWESEALPIGNGSLGAMVFGGVEHERLQLNEHSLWSGHPEVLDGPQTLEALPKGGQRLFDHNTPKAPAWPRGVRGRGPPAPVPDSPSPALRSICRR